jgi:hypothetical protein
VNKDKEEEEENIGHSSNNTLGSKGYEAGDDTEQVCIDLLEREREYVCVCVCSPSTQANALILREGRPRAFLAQSQMRRMVFLLSNVREFLTPLSVVPINTHTHTYVRKLVHGRDFLR